MGLVVKDAVVGVMDGNVVDGFCFGEVCPLVVGGCVVAFVVFTVSVVMAMVDGKSFVKLVVVSLTEERIVVRGKRCSC